MIIRGDDKSGLFFSLLSSEFYGENNNNKIFSRSRSTINTLV